MEEALAGILRRAGGDGCRESQAALRRAIEDVLSDAPRAGSPGTFTAEQVTHVLAVACETPSQSGLPIDDWTGRELAAEMVRRRIVESISPSTVQRYLAAVCTPAPSEQVLAQHDGERPRVVRATGASGLPDLLGSPERCISSTTRIPSASTR